MYETRDAQIAFVLPVPQRARIELKGDEIHIEVEASTAVPPPGKTFMTIKAASEEVARKMFDTLMSDDGVRLETPMLQQIMTNRMGFEFLVANHFAAVVPLHAECTASTLAG